MTPTRAFVLIAALVIALGAGAYIAYDQVLRGDSAPALTLPSAAASKAPTSSTASSSSDPATSADPAASAGDIAGTWTVSSGSQAGYRVREQLANLPAQSDAVGRTSDVTGSITLETSGATTTLSAGTITVNTTTIVSDKNQRDNRMRTDGLQTDQFTTATFTLTAPVVVPAAALAGTPSDVSLTGDLTLHGVTKNVTIPAQAQLVDGVVSVAGSISFPLSDYSITAPNVGGVIISVEDHGALEFAVNFTKS
jgi:polyisoprenoid-binding protein YceI